MSHENEKNEQVGKVFTDPKDLLSAMPSPKVEKKWSSTLNGYVYMKQMSAADQDTYDRSMVDFVEQDDGSVKTEQKMDNMRCKYLVRVLSDSKGYRLYSDEQAEALGAKLTGVIRELHGLALEVNGIGQRQVEELEKNLKAEPVEDSPSD
jgi:hypothetical protein